MKENTRFHELDALRGLAAVSVILLHFVDMFFPQDLAASRTHAQRVLCFIFAPFYRGHEAVMLFFVLSGFVLSLTYLRNRQQSNTTFLVRRVVRIYCPYVAALAVAVLGAAIWHGHLGMGQWAEHSWTEAPDLHSILAHLAFIGMYNWHRYNMVLWSLIVEMRISLLFPWLFAFVARVPLVLNVLAGVGCVLLSREASNLWPPTDNSTYTVAYIATFICGILLAKHLGTVNRWFQDRNQAQRLILIFLCVAAYFGGHLLRHGSAPTILLGAIGMIALALNSEHFGRLLRLRVPVFLGRISYSLYLIHLPILFALVFMLHTKIGPAAIFFLYVPLALGMAHLFHLTVESPLIKLSHRIGRAAKVRDDVHALAS